MARMADAEKAEMYRRQLGGVIAALRRERQRSKQLEKELEAERGIARCRFYNPEKDSCSAKDCAECNYTKEVRAQRDEFKRRNSELGIEVARLKRKIAALRGEDDG